MFHIYILLLTIKLLVIEYNYIFKYDTNNYCIMTIKNISDIINFLNTHTWRETADYFDISEMSIKRILDRQRFNSEIEKYNYTTIFRREFDKLLKKNLIDMKTSELRILYYILYNKNNSLRRVEYIKNILKKIKKG